MPLNGNERLKVLYDYYHLGDEGSFDFDIKKAKKVGADFRNDLCNSRESVIRITIFLRKSHMPREQRKRRLRKSWMMSVRMTSAFSSWE